MTAVVALKEMTCGGCGIHFAVPSEWYDTKKNYGGGFHCPNGCTRIFKVPEVVRLQKELEEKERQLRQSKCDTLAERQRREEAEKVIALKDRKLKRVSKGVCPHCNRSFENLKLHMQCKHKKAIAA